MPSPICSHTGKASWTLGSSSTVEEAPGSPATSVCSIWLSGERMHRTASTARSGGSESAPTATEAPPSGVALGVSGSTRWHRVHPTSSEKPSGSVLDSSAAAKAART